jgi:RND family efflux transporter MFP subunit
MPVSGQVTDFAEFPGQTGARVTVQVRSRVSGYLTKVFFKDGTIIKENDLLFEVDPRPYKAEFDRSVGNVTQMESHLRRLEHEYRRAEKLLMKGSISQEEFERYEADYKETVGNLEIAKANRELAELNLKWTEVRAPSAGQLSRRMVDPGNLVKADDTALTSIVTQDPMYVYFDVDEQNTLKVRRLIREGVVKAKSESEVPVLIGLSDEAPDFPHSGIVDFTDNQVDVSTGSLRFRATVRNEKGVFIPGLFVRVRLQIGDPHKVLFVREESLASDQGNKVVYVVKEKEAEKPVAQTAASSGHGEAAPAPGKGTQDLAQASPPASKTDDKNKRYTVMTKRVTLGALREGFRAIESGLSPEDKVVISGLQRIRPGAEFLATEKKISQSLPKDISFQQRPTGLDPAISRPADQLTRNVKP